MSISSTAGSNYETLTTTSTASQCDRRRRRHGGDADGERGLGDGRHGSVVCHRQRGTIRVTRQRPGGDAVNSATITIPGGQLRRQQRAGGGDARRRRLRRGLNYTAGTVSISSTARRQPEAPATTSTATVNVTDDADATVVTLTASAALGDGRRQRGPIPPAWFQCGDRQRPGGDAVQQRHDHDPGGQLERQQRAGDGDAGRRRHVEGTTAETVSISSTAGGNYEALTTTSTATVNVTDDADATGGDADGERGLGDGRRQRGLYRQRGTMR